MRVFAFGLASIVTAAFVTGCGCSDNQKERRLRQLNLDYWQRLSQVEKRLEYTAGEGVRTGSDAVNIGNHSAKEIEEIPITDIDTELVQLAQDVASLCRTWGQFVENHYSSSALAVRFMSGFINGLTLNLSAGNADDKKIEDGRQALLAETNKLRQRAAHLRVKLSNKYGVEFPPLKV